LTRAHASVAVIALFVVWIPGRFARAESDGCDVGDGDRVSVEIASTVDSIVSTAALAHLAAELAPRQIIVCTTVAEPGARPALARIFVTGSDTAFVNLRVHDEGSHTTVERSFDLAVVPPEGRALTLGLAAEALLSMLLSGPPRPAKVETPPPVVETTRQRDSHPESLTPSPRRFTASVLANVTGYTSGATLWGPQLHLRHVQGRFRPAVYGGMRRANAIQSTRGRVAFQDAHLGLEFGWLATRVEHRLALVLLGGLEGSWVNVAGEAFEGNTARRGFGIAALVYAGAEASIPMGEAVRLMLRAGGGHALRSVRASDSGNSVAGVQGLALQVSLGMGASF
jgi:hypothetical protein